MPARGRIAAALRRQWFLLSLAVIVALGISAAGALAPVADLVPRGPLVAAILFAMAAPLPLGRALAGRGAAGAIAVGVVVNALIAPPAAWLVGRLTLGEPWAMGLVVAALAPTTLASAAVWTRRGGGNDAVALAVTVVTNLATFLVAPAWAWALLAAGSETAGAVDAASLAIQLLAVVVAPIAAAQALRRADPFRRWADRRRSVLSTAAQVGLLAMVLVGSVRAGEAVGAHSAVAGQTPALIGSVVVLHLTLFAAGWWGAVAVGAPRAEALAAAIAGSQKTLAVGIDIGLALGESTGLGGVLILPMVVYHAGQLLADAFLADWLGPVGRSRRLSGRRGGVSEATGAS